MPATRFKCPDGTTIPIKNCLEKCPFNQRCIARPAITALAKGVGNRKLNQFSVTELLRSTRETYLMKLYNYPVDPFKLVLAAQGTALHNFNEVVVKDKSWLITEERLYNEIASGQIDSYGYIFNNQELVICDYKLTTTYKIAKAMGIGYNIEKTDEVYKTGPKKGTFKTKKVLSNNKVKSRMDWALQQNFYRMLLEEQGYKVDGMYIQAYARDFSSTTPKYGIDKPMNIIKLNKISDHWLKIWFKEKQKRITEALEKRKLPPICNAKETWNGLKCEKFCDVADICQKFQQEKQEIKSNKPIHTQSA